MNQQPLQPDRVYQRLFFYLTLLLISSFGCLYMITTGILPRPTALHTLENIHKTNHIADTFTSELDIEIDEIHQALLNHKFEYAIVTYNWIIENYGEERDHSLGVKRLKSFRRAMVEYVQLSEEQDAPCSPMLCEEIEAILEHVYDIRNRYSERTTEEVKSFRCPICIKEQSAIFIKKWAQFFW